MEKAFESNEFYVFKPKLRIENALKVRHVGAYSDLYRTKNAMQAYILENGFSPITDFYYSVICNDTVGMVDIYVGINGNIATNGTINSDENINFNGNKYENAKIETINISQKLRDEYFSSEDISRFAEDYELSEMNINLKISLDVQGDINLSGNVNSNTEIFALENIKLNGESLNANNSVIYSQLGDVDIDFSNVNFSGLIYAPNGDVEISGQGINLNNVVIIADAITLDGQYININYSSSFAESVGAQSENNNDSSGESSSQVDDNSSETENSQIEESSSVTDSSESDDTSSDEDSSIIDSSQADESSSVSDSSSIDDSSKPDDSSSEDTDMLDDDGDGLVNAYEKMLGTDKDNPDTDGDGLTDWQEVVFTGTDPLKFDSVTEGISDAKADSDGDGLSNVQRKLNLEQILRTLIPTAMDFQIATR